INSRAAMGVIFGISAVLLLHTLLITATHLFNYPNNIWVALYIPIVPMFLGYLFFSCGLTLITASQSMRLALVEIRVASLLEVVVVGESLTMNSYLCLVL
ncbi:EamA family transporter, partial [Acinetobacter baumannii]|uniref:EamA family transporter n=1 Tax=Acinetobacter baumannii TaxID=470 RepID=UPI0011C4E4B6